MPLSRYNSLVRIQRLTIDNATWTAVQKITGEAFTHLFLYNSAIIDVLLRSDSADSGTEELIRGGDVWTLEMGDLKVRQSILPEVPICYLKSLSGTGPVIIRWYL